MTEPHIDKVKSLLDSGVSPDSVDDPTNEEGHSALEIAASYGNVSMVRLLLDRGADINAPSFWGSTALVAAAVSGQPEVIELLLQRGADVDANDDGATALGSAKGHLQECKNAAERQRCARTVELLKQAGAPEFFWLF